MRGTLLEVLERHVEHKPDAISYRFISGKQEEILTNEDLWRFVRRLAGNIEGIIQEKERALILMPSSNLYLISLLACFSQNVIAVPAYPIQEKNSMQTQRVLSIIKNCQPTLILSTSDLLLKIRTGFSFEHPLNQIKHLAVDVAIATPKEPKDFVATPEDIAFLQYTSGSTSDPKGVMVTHDNLMANLQMLVDGLRINPEDSHVSWLPLFHDMGLVAGAFMGLFACNPVTFMRPIDFVRCPFLWLETISKYQATASGGPNFAYDLCCEKIQDSMLCDLNLTSWKVAYNGAEPVRASTLHNFGKKFSACGFNPNTFFPAYGMAETTLFISGGEAVVKLIDRKAFAKNQIVFVEKEEANTRSIVRCGHTRWGDQEVWVVDPKTHEKLNALQVGEIWIKGRHVTKGYYQNPEGYSAYTLDQRGPFLKTGDLGFMDDVGNLYIAGRLKDLIIVNGQNYHPNDIEAIAEKAHLAVVSNGTALIEDFYSPKIILVAEISGEYEQEEIAKALMKKVEEETQLLISECILVKRRKLPKTSSGKIQRKKLAHMLDYNQIDILYRYQRLEEKPQPIVIDAVEYMRDEDLRTNISNYCQHWIAMRKKKPLEEISVEDPLPSFGLDSLNAVDLIIGLEGFLKTELDASLIFDAKSIKDLARMIEREEKREAQYA